jgi:hypothetical protein
VIFTAVSVIRCVRCTVLDSVWFGRRLLSRHGCFGEISSFLSVRRFHGLVCPLRSLFCLYLLLRLISVYKFVVPECFNVDDLVVVMIAAPCGAELLHDLAGRSSDCLIVF